MYSIWTYPIGIVWWWLITSILHEMRSHTDRRIPSAELPYPCRIAYTRAALFKRMLAWYLWHRNPNIPHQHYAIEYTIPPQSAVYNSRWLSFLRSIVPIIQDYFTKLTQSQRREPEEYGHKITGVDDITTKKRKLCKKNMALSTIVRVIWWYEYVSH